MSMRKHSLFLLTIVIALSLTACWDRIDIESRAYILGIAVDQYPPVPKESEDPEKGEATPEEEEKLEHMELHSNAPMYAMTIQIPIIKKAGTLPPGSGKGGGSSEGSRSWELVQIGNSFMEMNREFAARLSHKPYYGHLQVIVISEEVAKSGLINILDFFVRDPEMRLRTKVFISRGEAKKVLDVMPRIEDYSSIYLAKIPMNARVNSRIIHKADLGETISTIHAGLDFLLPQVEASKDEIKTVGAAIFKEDKMVGWTDEMQLEYVKLVHGFYRGGVITVPDPVNKNAVVTLEVIKAKTKVTPILEDHVVSFHIQIQLKGNYTERMNANQQIHIDTDYLKAVEKALSNQVSQQCSDTIRKIQEEYGADIFHFSELLRVKEPAFWDKIKDNWYEIFPGVNTEVEVTVDIRQVGNTR